MMPEGKFLKVPLDYNRFRFRLYFESSCPHCKRMFQTMKDLQTRGYFVELRQIDKGPKGPMRLPFPVTYASRKEVKEKNINSWPTLFIGDLKKKIVYRLKGYHSSLDILSVIRNR